MEEEDKPHPKLGLREEYHGSGLWWAPSSRLLPCFLYDASNRKIPSQNWRLSATDFSGESTNQKRFAYAKPYTGLSFDMSNAKTITWRMSDPVVSLALDRHPDANVQALQGIEVRVSARDLASSPYAIEAGRVSESYVIFFPQGPFTHDECSDYGLWEHRFDDRPDGLHAKTDANTLYSVLKVPIVPGETRTDVLPRELTYSYELGVGDGCRRAFSLPPGVYTNSEDVFRCEPQASRLRRALDDSPYRVVVDVPGGKEHTFDLTERVLSPKHEVLGCEGQVLFAPGWSLARKRTNIRQGLAYAEPPGPPPVGAGVYLRARLSTTSWYDWEPNFKLGGWGDNFSKEWDAKQDLTNVVQIFEELPFEDEKGWQYYAPWAGTRDTYLAVDVQKVPDGTLTLRARPFERDDAHRYGERENYVADERKSTECL